MKKLIIVLSTLLIVTSVHAQTFSEMEKTHEKANDMIYEGMLEEEKRLYDSILYRIRKGTATPTEIDQINGLIKKASDRSNNRLKELYRDFVDRKTNLGDQIYYVERVINCNTLKLTNGESVRLRHKINSSCSCDFPLIRISAYIR